MALSVKDPEADRLAREVAARWSPRPRCSRRHSLSKHARASLVGAELDSLIHKADVVAVPVDAEHVSEARVSVA
jgi:hypothetical protein